MLIAGINSFCNKSGYIYCKKDSEVGGFMRVLLMKLDLFYYATNIPLRLYDGENGRISSNLLASQVMPPSLDFGEYEKRLLELSEDTLYYTNDLEEHYYSFRFRHDGREYKLAAGPTIDPSFDKNRLMRIAGGKKLKLSDYGALEAYQRSLPRYTSAALRRTEPLLKFLLCGSEPDLPEMMKRDRLPEDLEEGRAQVLEAQRYHHSLNQDALILEALKNGDRDRLFTLLCTPGDGPEGVLCRDNPLRSYKNLFIVTVSHTTKAAIEGGVDSESAYTLSDTYIQTVEEIDSHEEVTELFIRMFNAFLDLVEKAKKLKYGSQVYSTIDYINKHYYENISIKELARRVHLSESHLLKLFKRQAGMGVKAFIINRRIAEAASLLRHTDRSIAEICDMTGFNDQSYMTNQFRKTLNTTPKKYRQDGGRGLSPRQE
jgi:AraC-like DNA-binding protein